MFSIPVSKRNCVGLLCVIGVIFAFGFLSQMKEINVVSEVQGHLERLLKSKFVDKSLYKQKGRSERPIRNGHLGLNAISPTMSTPVKSTMSAQNISPSTMPVSTMSEKSEFAQTMSTEIMSLSTMSAPVKPALNMFHRNTHGHNMAIESNRPMSTSKTSSNITNNVKGSDVEHNGIYIESGSESVNERRRQAVKQACIDSGRGFQNEYKDKNYLIYPKLNLLYCPIAKCSSTFWKGTFKKIEAGQGVRINRLDKTDLDNLMDNEHSLIIVRDPYARLLSAYTNKIYHPEIHFWRSLGRPAALLTRNITMTKEGKPYGYDVTFSEMIKYVLAYYPSDPNREHHFSPMYRQCDPCKHDFKYVSHLETITEDYKFIMNNLLPGKNVTTIFDAFTNRTANGRIQHLFEAKKIMPKIDLPFHKLMLRTWRDLQIRGFLSKHVPFPFYEEEIALSVTPEELMEAIVKGVAETVDKEDAKRQRKEALIQAYRTVSIEDMERLAKYVELDCKLFGFENRPKQLFDRSNPIETSFVYFDGLT